jgi:hypothetical protein
MTYIYISLALFHLFIPQVVHIVARRHGCAWASLRKALVCMHRFRAG